MSKTVDKVIAEGTLGLVAGAKNIRVRRIFSVNKIFDIFDKNYEKVIKNSILPAFASHPTSQLVAKLLHPK